MPDQERLPYDGLRILDLSQGMAGPACGMQFALYGADVIKVEPPEGDWVRALGRTYGDQSALSLASNRGKRSIALDLKKPGGIAVLRRLIADSDVLIESNRVGASERLGIGYAQIRSLNERLIYVSVTGFGSVGPYARQTATDTVIQAFSGMMSHAIPSQGRPAKIDFLIADSVAALTVFQATSAALFQRERDGRGRHLEVNLLDACAGVQAYKLIEQSLEGGQAQKLNVPAGNYATQDGWISLSLMREQHFEAICAVAGLSGLAQNPRFSTFAARAVHAEEIIALLGERLARRPTAEWVAAFKAADVLCAPVNTLGDWLADPHVVAVGAAVGIEHPGVGHYKVPRVPGWPGTSRSAARSPALGGDGMEVLQGCGYDAAEIAELAGSGAVLLSNGNGAKG